MNKKLLLCIVLFCNAGLSAQVRVDLSQLRDSVTKSAISNDYCDFESVSLDGKVFSKKDLIGKITLIDLWFEACSPCIAEMGYLIELYGRLKDNNNFQFLSFTIDNSEVAKKAVEKYNIPYIVCPISREEASRMNFRRGFPTKIIINKEGKIVFLESGGPTDPESVKRKIKKMEGQIKHLLLSE